MHRCLISSLLLICLSLLSLTSSAEIKIPAPDPLPNVTAEMTAPGYWISRHPAPDTVLLTRADIEQFNRDVINKNLIQDIFDPAVTLTEFKDNFEQTVRDHQKRGYFNDQNIPASSGFFDSILDNMNREALFSPQYGVVAQFADERILPTDQGLYESPDDFEFDQLQNSGLDPGTPVLVLHASRDGQWLYEINELTEGWTRSEKIALGEKNTVQLFTSADRFALAVRPKAIVFAGQGRLHPVSKIRMGARLPLDAQPDYGLPIQNSDAIFVQIPSRDPSGRLVINPGSMNAVETRTTFLPFTPRHVFRQAFFMRDQPYGWGGRGGEQDCSRYLQQVFATFGIRLPRNSWQQAQTGRNIAAFDASTSDDQKREALKSLEKGIYILTLKGHVMLYLGNADGEFYAIHDIHAYREPSADGDIARVINRVAVTDLSLGEGSKRGSLLRRLTGIRGITFPAHSEKQAK